MHNLFFILVETQALWNENTLEGLLDSPDAPHGAGLFNVHNWSLMAEKAGNPIGPPKSNIA